MLGLVGFDVVCGLPLVQLTGYRVSLWRLGAPLGLLHVFEEALLLQVIVEKTRAFVLSTLNVGQLLQLGLDQIRYFLLKLAAIGLKFCGQGLVNFGLDCLFRELGCALATGTGTINAFLDLGCGP